jgi:UPF0271 protein
MQIIDINIDVGEGVGNESLLLPLVSSCNIACGGHAGDEKTMKAIVELAKTNKVKIGAHPSYPDKLNFGRQEIEISCANLYTSLKQQIRSLLLVLRDKHLMLHHIKPHGALYNKAAVDIKTATVIVEVIKGIALPLKLYAPYNSVLANLAIKEGVQVINEAFADRNYNDDLTLVSRINNNSIINDVDMAFEHLLRMIQEKKVKTINGLEADIKADTFCIHGDHPKAYEFITYFRNKLKENNIIIQ